MFRTRCSSPRMNVSFKKNVLSAFGAQGVFLASKFVTVLILPRFLPVGEYAYWQLFLFYASYAEYAHIGIIGLPEDIVIGNSGLLFGSEVFREVADNIAFHTDRGGAPGRAGGGHRVDARAVVGKVRGKVSHARVVLREISGELIDNRADHLQMTQAFMIIEESLIIKQKNSNWLKRI